MNEVYFKFADKMSDKDLKSHFYVISGDQYG